VNGVVYAIGGYVSEPTGLQVQARVDAYDVASNTWRQKRPLPEASLPHGATAINGRIHVAGGWTDSRLSKRLYVYDPATDTWTRRADLPFTIDRYAGHQATIGGKLYVYAGVTVNADGSKGARRFLRYDPATNKWASLARPSYARLGGPRDRRPVRAEQRGPGIRSARRKALHRGLHQRLQHQCQRRVRSGRQCGVAILLRTAGRPRRRGGAQGTVLRPGWIGERA
jgi:N-acetylneuraminic acid mutarotase